MKWPQVAYFQVAADKYDLFEMEDAGKAALKPGKNSLAVHCHQTQGGQFVDVGIVDVGN